MATRHPTAWTGDSSRAERPVRNRWRSPSSSSTERPDRRVAAVGSMPTCRRERRVRSSSTPAARQPSCSGTRHSWRPTTWRCLRPRPHRWDHLHREPRSSTAVEQSGTRTNPDDVGSTSPTSSASRSTGSRLVEPPRGGGPPARDRVHRGDHPCPGRREADGGPLGLRSGRCVGQLLSTGRKPEGQVAAKPRSSSSTPSARFGPRHWRGAGDARVRRRTARRAGRHLGREADKTNEDGDVYRALGGSQPVSNAPAGARWRDRPHRTARSQRIGAPRSSKQRLDAHGLARDRVSRR